MTSVTWEKLYQNEKTFSNSTYLPHPNSWYPLSILPQVYQSLGAWSVAHPLQCLQFEEGLAVASRLLMPVVTHYPCKGRIWVIAAALRHVTSVMWYCLVRVFLMLTRVAHVAFVHKLDTGFNKCMNITSTFQFCKSCNRYSYYLKSLLSFPWLSGGTVEN